MRADRKKPVKRSATRVVLSESSSKRAAEISRVRLMYMALFFTFMFLALSARLVDVSLRTPDTQKAETAHQEPMTEEEWLEQVVAGVEKSVRGEVVDRNGVVVATSLKTASLYANPRIMTDKEEAVKKLVGTLPLDEGILRRKFASDKTFVWVKRNLTPAEQQKVNTLGIPGLYFEEEERRVYPYANLLSHVLGYVGVDNKGLAGVEQYFDKRLRDGTENKNPLALSIDLRVQNIVHEEMERAVKEFQAIGATGIVMELGSGEILAMANLPDFDPHHPTRASDEKRFNRASLGAYEMGSTFKTFTAAMALDYGTVKLNGGYDARAPIHIGRFTISDTHPENRWLSVPEIFAYSSNIGTVRMAMDVGVSKQKMFLEKLGFMKPVDIELPELANPMWPKDWKPINLMTISYGHGMAVSPLHLVQGIATMVHDGTLAHLTLVKEGNKNKVPGVRVVSEDTVSKVRRLMRLVVEHGTAKKAGVEGYDVGGKTGTAEKVAGRGYNAHAKLALFVGAFPINNPKYLVLMMVDEPRGNKSTYGFATGGWIAAPVVNRIVSRMGPLYGIAPDFDIPVDNELEQYWVKKETPPPAPAIMPAVEQAVHAVSY